jgi:hypothetical protein
MNIDDLATALEVVSPEGEAPLPTASKKTRPPGEKIPAGERDSTLFKAASSLARLGASEENIQNTLWNLYVNDMEHKPTDRESEVKARIAQKAKRSLAGAAYDVPVVAHAPGAVKKGPLFVPVADLLETPRAPKWFVRGYIESPSTARIFGASGTGKSFLASDMALASATGGRWMGKRVTGGPVYYIAGEGHTGLERRFKALQLHHGIERLPGCLYLSTARIELNVVGSLEVEMEIERISKKTNTSPALVVIDTLARAMPAGKDENSTKDMGEFINEVDKIRDKLQCVAVIIHHTGNSETHRARGSSAMLAAVDAEMHVFMQGDARVAKWVKLKDQPLDPNGYEFTLRRVALGEDETAEEGEDKIVSSCVVEWVGEAAVQTTKPLTRGENLGLETLRHSITEGYSAPLEAWRAPSTRSTGG